MDFILKGIFALAITASASTTKVQTLCNGYLPKNNMRIGVNEKSLEGGLNQEEFTAILKEAKAAYSQIFEIQVGKPLVVYGAWEEAEVNAYATVEDGKSLIVFFGGLARHPNMSPDAFRTVVCHEIGHHLGGAPTASLFTSMSAEGQADYYGTAKCMKLLLKGQENVAILDSPNVPELALATCEKIYSTAEEQAICVRSQMAALDAGKVMASLSNISHPQLDTPDTLVVAKTNRRYPSVQCRTDTQALGALCSKVGGLVLDSSVEEHETICKQGVDEIGYRPNCWYKPRSL